MPIISISISYKTPGPTFVFPETTLASANPLCNASRTICLQEIKHHRALTRLTHEHETLAKKPTNPNATEYVMPLAPPRSTRCFCLSSLLLLLLFRGLSSLPHLRLLSADVVGRGYRTEVFDLIQGVVEVDFTVGFALEFAGGKILVWYLRPEDLKCQAKLTLHSPAALAAPNAPRRSDPPVVLSPPPPVPWLFVLRRPPLLSF